MKDIDIPDFITLVATEVREAIQRFRNTGNEPLLYLRGLQLHIAFTAEESSQKDGKIQLKPFVISSGAETKESEKSKIIHAITIDLAALLVEEKTPPPPPFTGRDLKEEDFSLLLQVISELRKSSVQDIFAGVDKELLEKPFVYWQGSTFSIRIRKRLAQQLILHIDKLNTIEDVAKLYEGALDDITFMPQNFPIGSNNINSALVASSSSEQYPPIAARPLGGGLR